MYDTDGTEGLTEGDLEEIYLYDLDWRLLSIFRTTFGAGEGGGEPLCYQQIVYQEAGNRDTPVMRRRDADLNGTLEEEQYYLTNHRGDITELVDVSGLVRERVRYSAYGVPELQPPPADFNRDWVVDSQDEFDFLGAYGGAETSADYNHDGLVDSDDYFAFLDDLACGGVVGATGEGPYAVDNDCDTGTGTNAPPLMGDGHLSNFDNRIGYGGYTWDPYIGLYHVRNRLYDPWQGRWLTRGSADFLESIWVDVAVGENLYQAFADPVGTGPLEEHSPDQRGMPSRVFYVLQFMDDLSPRPHFGGGDWGYWHNFGEGWNELFGEAETGVGALLQGLGKSVIGIAKAVVIGTLVIAALPFEIPAVAVVAIGGTLLIASGYMLGNDLYEVATGNEVDAWGDPTGERIEGLDRWRKAGEVIGDAAGMAFGGKIGQVSESSLKNLRCKLRSGGTCFVAGTLVAMAAHGLVPIESLRIGDRVLTADESACDTDVDPATYREVDIVMPNPDGSDDLIQIVLLRSEKWIEQVHADSDQWIDLGLPEMGLFGPAMVTAIKPCPKIDDGPGRVVLATLTHLNGYVLELRFVGSSVKLRPTETHRLYSEDRKDWIPTRQLESGERLRSAKGAVEIEAIVRVPGLHQVYNIEVEKDHNYLVATLEVLSHNECGRAGKQTRLRQLGADPKQPSHVRGWIQQERNQIQRGKRTSIRVPPGYVLAHNRGMRASNGFSYLFSKLQNIANHKLEHCFGSYR